MSASEREAASGEDMIARSTYPSLRRGAFDGHDNGSVLKGRLDLQFALEGPNRVKLALERDELDLGILARDVLYISREGRTAFGWSLGRHFMVDARTKKLTWIELPRGYLADDLAPDGSWVLALEPRTNEMPQYRLHKVPLILRLIVRNASKSPASTTTISTVTLTG